MDNKQTDKAMARRMWIRHRKDDAFFGRHRYRFAFWNWIGGWFGIESPYDSRHK